MDSTEVPVYDQQENSAYNGHSESACNHPLLLFNREGDCLAAKLRPVPPLPCRKFTKGWRRGREVRIRIPANDGLGRPSGSE
jgi:hypothetical protein